MGIVGSTTIYGIIGWPVRHSLSPLFQNDFIMQRGLDACYVPFPVAPENLEAALHGLRSSGIQGLNVTIPHKAEACRQVAADAAARIIGAVNTLKPADTGWQGCNTDYLGIQAVLQGLQATAERAMIFGAGGTSRAAIHALADMGCQQLVLTNRTRARAEQLQQHAQTCYPAMSCEVIDWQPDAVAACTAHMELCINCSSIGLHAEDRFPFAIDGHGVAMDAVYRPDGDTAFCRQAVHRQCCDGLPMLIAQGIASFTWWHETETAPDPLLSLRRVENQLGRTPVLLPGWPDMEKRA